MNTAMQSAFRLTCPEGRRFAVAITASGTRGDDVFRFLNQAVRVLVCQSMSCATAVDTLDLAVAHYFPKLDVSAGAIVAECDEECIRWCSAGDLEAIHVAGPARFDRLVSCGPSLGSGARGAYVERSFEPLIDGILALAAPSKEIERLMLPIVQSLHLGIRPDSMHFQGALLMRTNGRDAAIAARAF